MSIIAAGTTTTTALSSTGNTDGTLQLQVNGTTPSVTLNTLGAIGVGSTPNYGTSGQALVSAGSTAAPTWANVTTSPAGSNTQIQYNNSGSFGASSAFVFDGTNLGVLGGSVTTPAAKIHAVGNVRSSNGAGTTYTSLATDGIYSTGTDLYVVAPSGYSNIFYTNNTEKFRFGTAGQLGIGGANYGSSGQVLTSGGSGAAPTWSTPAGGFSGSVSFTSSGTWTYPAGVTKAWIIVTGGGGSGVNGFSGGSGGTAIKFVNLAGSSATITIGAGGSGGGSGGASQWTDGTTSIYAGGGNAGGGPGYGSGGDINVAGGWGSSGFSIGGASFWGGGGAGQNSGYYTGTAAEAFGAGGGTYSGNNNGKAGVVYIVY